MMELRFFISSSDRDFCPTLVNCLVVSAVKFSVTNWDAISNATALYSETASPAAICPGKGETRQYNRNKFLNFAISKFFRDTTGFEMHEVCTTKYVELHRFSY